MRVAPDAFRGFYEELMAMVREGVPAARITQKIRKTVPDVESRRQLVGHLRDSWDAFEAEGRDELAVILGSVIESLDEPEGTQQGAR